MPCEPRDPAVVGGRPEERVAVLGHCELHAVVARRARRADRRGHRQVSGLPDELLQRHHLRQREARAGELQPDLRVAVAPGPVVARVPHREDRVDGAAAGARRGSAPGAERWRSRQVGAGGWPRGPALGRLSTPSTASKTSDLAPRSKCGTGSSATPARSGRRSEPRAPLRRAPGHEAGRGAVLLSGRGVRHRPAAAFLLRREQREAANVRGSGARSGRSAARPDDRLLLPESAENLLSYEAQFSKRVKTTGRPQLTANRGE